MLVNGHAVAYEMQARATHQGPLTTPTGTLAATNRRIGMRMGILAEVDAAGLTVLERRYFDVAGLPRQLGLDT